MKRVAITGHMNLTAETESQVEQALRLVLAPLAPAGLVGVSCLAAGSDTIFARTVLDVGGELDVILPSATYRDRKVSPDARDAFDALFSRAREVYVLPFEEPDRAAYEAANTALLQRCDELIAVWDGEPSAGRGGTAAVVQAARAADRRVQVIWPRRRRALLIAVVVRWNGLLGGVEDARVDEDEQVSVDAVRSHDGHSAGKVDLGGSQARCRIGAVVSQRGPSAGLSL